MPSSADGPDRTVVSVDACGDFARLVLVPPPGKPPTLDHEVLRELDAAVARWEADPPRLLVVASASEKVFCAGANLAVLRETNERSIVPWVEVGHRVLARLEDLPCPVVAHVAGHVLGGGLELALACDLIYATDAATFGLTEAQLGFVPGWGGSFRLPERIGLAHAKRLFFQSARIAPDEAARIGLVDFAGTADEVLCELDRLAATVAGLSPTALAGFKRITGSARRTAREASLRAETEASVACLCDSDTKTRIAAFLNRKK